MKFIYYVIKFTNHIYYYVILKRLCIKICENTESCYYSQSLDMNKRVWNTYGELQKWLKMMLLGSHICLYDRSF